MTHHFGPIELIKGIEEQYKDYLVSTFHTDNNVLNGEIEHKIRDEYQFFKGPYIQMADIYSTGESIKALVSDGVLSDKFLELNSKKLPIDRPLYSHQVRSIKNVVVRDHNTVISTGTGSGKTEGFLIPILNHIMEEGDEIALPGVRAMIIYPMNALVNDQMRRLSEVLYYYQKIKFGFFTGETKGLKTIEDYRSRFGRDPGSNELFKEDDLRKSPPHILITNYSMLEHILIRYENSVEIFNKDNAARWKYIVLDEVHTYGGATGIEVSMLLRRVLATIDNNSVRFILTSATLGDEDSNEEVADFASNLTSQHFEDSDVIRADRILRSEPQECDSQSFELYEGIWDRIHHGSGATESDSIAVLLDSLFWKIYHVLSDKDNCHTIESLGALTGLQCSDVEKFIDVVNTLKDENGHKLIDSKYHTFVKALEGIYFTLGPSFKTSLTKTNVIMDDSHGREFPAFNLAVCFNCNAVFVPGRINNKYQLVNSNDVDEDSEGMSSSELFRQYRHKIVVHN